MSKAINILFAIDYFHRTGGTEIHLAQLAKGLSTDAFNCHVVIFDMGQSSLLDGVRDAGIPILHLPVRKIYSPNAMIRARELSRYIRANHIDIVQTFHQTSDTYAAAIARVSGVRHIISSKRDTGQLKRPLHVRLNRLCRPLFEKVIVVADAVAEAVVAKEGIPRSRIVRIYNGVDADRFRPPTAEEITRQRDRLGLDRRDFVVGMVAGFRPEKNYHVFFEGALRALQAIPTLKVIAVGGGPLLEHYRGQYAGHDHASRVIFTGAVTDVSACLKAMDVGCLIPGSNEGFSNAVLEKMATGLPVIVTAVGGNTEAVVHGANGLIIPPGDVQAFCDALVDIHSSVERRLSMGARSRQLVEEQFTLAEMERRHKELYVSISR